MPPATSDFDDNSNDQLLRPKDAAKRLGVSTRTLADWADAGRLQARRLPSGARRYRASDIDALANA